MRITAVLFTALFLISTQCVAHCYVLPDPVELAKRFAELEAIAKDATPGARQVLVSVCASKKDRVQYRRFAYRLLSRIGELGDIDGLPVLTETDQLWSCRRIAEIRITARKKGESKAALAKQLLSFYETLSSQAALGIGSDWVISGIEKRLAEQEIGFQIADAGLPLEGFPSELTDRSVDVELYRLRTKHAGIPEIGERARLVLRGLETATPFYSEAAEAYVGELGEAALPMVINTLRRNIPDHNPPPYDETTRVITSCLDIVAHIGGTRGQAVLKEYSKSSLPYVASKAAAWLRWMEGPVKYPARYLRLFQHPYVDE